MFPGYARESIQKERLWILQCHALMQMLLLVSMRKKKKKVVEIANGCFASKVMIFKAKEFCL